MASKYSDIIRSGGIQESLEQENLKIHKPKALIRVYEISLQFNNNQKGHYLVNL